jgi:hypothetical protein
MVISMIIAVWILSILPKWALPGRYEKFMNKKWPVQTGLLTGHFVIILFLWR